MCLFIYLRFVPSNLVDRNWSRKKWACWQKSAKRTVSIPNWFHFLIFISHSFTWKLTNKNGSFVTSFWKKCWNFAQVSWNCYIGITFWNCQIRPEKNETGGTRVVTKLSFLFVSFQVKLCEIKIKKWNQFGFETVLLANFCQQALFFLDQFLSTTLLGTNLR